MFIEIISFLIVLTAYVVLRDSTISYSSKRKRFLFIIGFVIVIVSGLRNLAVGADTYQYYLAFEEIKNTSWDIVFQAFRDYFVSGEGKDPGYILLEKAFQSILPDYRSFLFAIISFFVYSLFRLLYKYNVTLDGIFISFCLYEALFYAFFSITGLRQTIATAFTLLSVPFALEKKWIRFLAMVFLASLIHKSSLIFVLFYFFCVIDVSSIVLIISLIAFVPMWFIGQTIGQRLIAGTIFDQYEVYLEGTYETSGAIVFAVLLVTISIMLLIKYKKIINIRLENHAFINAIAFAVLYTPMTSVGPSQMRVVQYFSIFLLILLPDIIDAWSTSRKQFDVVRIVSVVLLFYYSCRIKQGYGFFWQDIPLPIHYGGTMIITGW